MSLRCAVCGSKRITIETKKEGYDLKKGVIGQALIGIPGALAGINEKDTTYYHCADCGQVLNRAMYAFESNSEAWRRYWEIRNDEDGTSNGQYHLACAERDSYVGGYPYKKADIVFNAIEAKRIDTLEEILRQEIDIDG